MEYAEYVAARRPRLVRSAVLLGCPESDAEDLVQTVLAKVLRSWRKVKGADSPDAYVQRILVNTFHDTRSRRWHGEVPTEVLPDTAIDTTDLSGGVAEGIAVRRALAAMTPEHREVLVLRFFADLSERDTALALGVAPGTVKSRTARALKALAADQNIARSTP